MNIGVITLCHKKILPYPLLYGSRLQIEDNIGEAVHIHYRNFRLDFTIKDFLKLEHTLYLSLLKVLEKKGLGNYVIDKKFLVAIANFIPHIISFEEKHMFLNDLKVIEYVKGGWTPSSIKNSPAYQYLQGNKNIYQDYLKNFGSIGHSIDNLENLQKEIIKKSYPSDGWIVTFGNQPYIRDGHHRAAILHHIYGNIQVPILNIQFEDSFTAWKLSNPISNPQSPIIIIDGVFFQLYKTGIARVWRTLLQQWANTEFANHILVLDRNNTAPKINGIRYRTIPHYNYNNTEADKQMLQQICDEEGAELFISSYYTTPVDTPSVFMAYDMIPEVVGRNLNDPMWIEKHKAINHASGFIAISENTAKDINKFFPNIPTESITVAHCGVDSLFSPASETEIENFKHKYGINKPYFLLGGLGGYKNSVLFFQAFNQLANKQGFDIVATGAGSQLPPEWRQFTAGCTFHGLQLTDEELRLAYAGAVALVYPSKYEGFGMPVIEAMACGCPVITTPNASLPEVGGKAAIYIQDDDIEGMADALCDVQKPSLRRQIIPAGLQQAQKFSWATMAEIMKEALFNAISPQINLTDTNYLITPDWQTDEEELTEELYNLISNLAQHSPLIKQDGGGSTPESESIITLVIDTTGITEEDANLILSGIAMNLMMEEELDLENLFNFSFISDFEESQWTKLLPQITARIVLNCENQDIVNNELFDELITIMADGNNYAIMPDWSKDEQELFTAFSEILTNISSEEKATLLINLNNSDAEDVGLFVSEVAMSLMLEEGVELSEDININFVNFTPNQWHSLQGLIKEEFIV